MATKTLNIVFSGDGMEVDGAIDAISETISDFTSWAEDCFDVSVHTFFEA